MQGAPERLFRLGVGVPPAGQPVVQARVPSGGDADVPEKPCELIDQGDVRPARVPRISLKVSECQAADGELPRQGAAAAAQAALLLGREPCKRPAAGTHHRAHMAGRDADQKDLCFGRRPLAGLLQAADAPPRGLVVRVPPACNDAGEHPESAPEYNPGDVIDAAVANRHQPEMDLGHHRKVHRLHLPWRVLVLFQRVMERHHRCEGAVVGESARRAPVRARRGTRVAAGGCDVLHRLAPRFGRREREARFAACQRARLPERAAPVTRLAAGAKVRRRGVVPELNCVCGAVAPAASLHRALRALESGPRAVVELLEFFSRVLS